MLTNSVAWLRANYKWLAPLLLLVSMNVANALLKYPQTEALGHKILDAVSFLTRSDSPDTIKMFGKRSKNPNKLAS
jgi:hypothetical protein